MTTGKNALRKRAVVAGASGVSGRALVEHLVSLGDWEVIGLSRRRPNSRHLPAMLQSTCSTEPTSTVWPANWATSRTFFTRPCSRETITSTKSLPNLAMLQQLVEACERSSTRLRKVVLLEGAKWYARISAPTRRPPKRMIRGTCRPTFITIRRITSNHNPREKAGPGRLCGPRASAVSRWETR